jgi:HEAT repeat protein
MKTRVMWKGIMAIAGAVVLSAVPVIAQPGAKAPKPGAVPGEIPGGEFALPPGTGALERPGAPVDWSEQREDREQERARETRQRERELYESGIEALDDDRYDRALERFNRVIEMNGSNVDGAKYWKAYAQNRLGQRAESLATIAELIKSHPNSRYVTQAKTLEADVRRSTGQSASPETQADEDLKLMAINALQHQDPERAVPMIEKLLAGNNSPKVKARALFVLAQFNSPAARQVLAKVARGESHPDLQRRAIQYLGIHGGRESRQLLEDIYKSTSDVDVKRRILQAFMVSGERARLLQVAQGETVPELRGEAVQQLGVMGAHDELWQLYTKESSRDVKKQILQAMFVGGNSERLIQLAKSESDPELRRVAVRNLGLMGSRRTGDALVEIYNTDKDPAIRKAVLEGLFIQNNAESLVAIARKENDMTMKRQIVSKLSLMRSKVAMDYLMEIIEK